MKCHKIARSRHLGSFQNFTNSKGMKEINWNNLKARVYHCEEPKMNMLKSYNHYPVPTDFRGTQGASMCKFYFQVLFKE
jgi:hypothetical protein